MHIWTNRLWHQYNYIYFSFNPLIRKNLSYKKQTKGVESSHKTRKNRIRTQQYYQCILNPTFNFRHIAITPPTSPAKINPKIKAMVEIPSVALRSSVGESKLDTSNQGARKTTITQMLTKIKTKHFLQWSSHHQNVIIHPDKQAFCSGGADVKTVILSVLGQCSTYTPSCNDSL